MNIFITGGTGFIGSHVSMAFLEQGHRITMLARNPNKVPKFAEISNIEIVEGDITDAKLIERLICGHDACVHIALNYNDSSGSEMLINDTLPTVQLSDYARNAKVKHFIYTSSTAANDSSYSSNSVKGDVNFSLITSQTKQRPSTFYGATKAASENFRIAQSYQSDMRINIIRPGYVFGNPVIEGAFTEGDTRFFNIVKAAQAHKPIYITENDGTQFISAPDLAKLYVAILESDVNRTTYQGLSKSFVTWKEIAMEAIKMTASNSEIIMQNSYLADDRVLWDVSDMKKDFELEFDPREQLREHLNYLIKL